MSNSIYLIEVETPHGTISRRVTPQRVSRNRYVAIAFLDGAIAVSFWSRSRQVAQQQVERWLRNQGRRFDGKGYEVIVAEAKLNPLPQLAEAKHG
jgi:hypothetical protein